MSSKMNTEGEMTMKPDYRNWIPKGMIMGLGTAAGVLAAGVPCRPIRPLTEADRMLP